MEGVLAHALQEPGPCIAVDSLAGASEGTRQVVPRAVLLDGLSTLLLDTPGSAAPALRRALGGFLDDAATDVSVTAGRTRWKIAVRVSTS